MSRKDQRKALRQAKKQRKNDYFQSRNKAMEHTQQSKSTGFPNGPQRSNGLKPQLNRAPKRIESDTDEEILSDSDAHESYSEDDAEKSVEADEGVAEDSFLDLIDKAFESGKLTKKGLIRENGETEDSEFEMEGSDGEDYEEDEWAGGDYSASSATEELCDSDSEQSTLSASTKVISTTQSKQPILPAINLHDESVQKLNKQLQSLVNKLSASNLVPISHDFEALLRTNKRKLVVELLTEIILSSLVRPGGNLLDSFAICFAGFSFIAYHIIGIEFGAHLIERLVETIDSLYQHASETEAERSLVNCISFCSFLYDLQVISHRMICDLLQQSANCLHEIDVEIILKLFRSCGANIRQDDINFLPLLLVQVHQKASTLSSEQKSSRFRFMLETLDELKDNKRKLVAALPAELEVIKKNLRALLTQKSLTKRDPLRISLEDIRNIEAKGKWWLVGSSWHPEDNKMPKLGDASQKSKESDTIDGLARSLRMNTELRRSIFSVIMTSDDHTDAFDRLIALKLTGKEERDIPLVLLHCCGQEKMYNPFYAFLAGHLINHKRMFLITFQYALWDALKQLQEFSLRKFSNLAYLYGHLLGTGSVPLATLRKANFIRMSEEEQAFWQILFMAAFTRQPPATTVEVMSNLAAAFVQSVEQNREARSNSGDSGVKKPRLLTKNFDMNEFDDEFFAAQSKITDGQSGTMSLEKLEECKGLRSGLLYFLDTFFITASDFPFAEDLIEPCRYQARKLRQSLAAVDFL